jgi:cyclic lactone autoinducer peptide
MLKNALQKNITRTIEFIGKKTAEKSMGQSCVFCIYQPKEPAALMARANEKAAR